MATTLKTAAPIAPMSALEKLRLELRAAELTISALTRELARTLEAPSVVSATAVNGVLTIIYSTGAVRQLTTVHAPDGFREEWRELPALPDTRAAIARGALETQREYAGMAVV